MQIKVRKKNAQRRRPGENAQVNKKPSVADETVYTPPKAFNRNRFFLRMAIVAAVVIAVMLGLSIFFKVDKIEVSGMGKYTAWDVRQASGLVAGENLLTVSKARISGNIIAALPYVSTVQVGIELPDTVKIHITELTVTYAVQASDDNWWLIGSDGRIIEKIAPSAADDYTRILGVKLADPVQGGNATAVEETPETTDEPEPTVVTDPVTVYGRDYLNAALTILDSLEKSGIIGQMATINVADLANIELWYGHQYQILLGDTTRIPYKISAIKQVIDQLGSYETGILDASFTLMPDKVIKSPLP